ncbi:MAG TPA: GNAT family N-acetyltransferase [Thermoplasmata archaeon]|nr:GNAT family N-acetyltransferase [Thermoplasmata archaeon]
MTVRSVRSLRQIEAVRALFLEYRTWQAVHREVTAFPDPILERGLRHLDDEIASLPGVYRPPEGALYLATVGREAAGCTGVRRIQPHVCELKRLYVRPDYRGWGIGRRLTRAALNGARTLGYRSVVLDTLPTMGSAIRLYHAMGFQPIPEYWPNPVEGALFFEYRLSGNAPVPLSRVVRHGTPER